MPGWKEYVQWSRDHRDYTGDPEAKDPHSFLLSLGVETVPHGSNAKPGQEQETFDSIEDLLKAGSFWDHLHGNEQVVRKWQELDGAAAYPDAVCHAALFHSSEPSPSLLLISPHPTCRPASTSSLLPPLCLVHFTGSRFTRAAPAASLRNRRVSGVHISHRAARPLTRAHRRAR